MASSGYDWEEPYLFFFNGTYEMEMNVVLDKVHSLHTYLHKAKLPGIGKGERVFWLRARPFMYGIIRSCNQSRKWFFFVQHANCDLWNWFCLASLTLVLITASLLSGIALDLG